MFAAHRVKPQPGDQVEMETANAHSLFRPLAGPPTLLIRLFVAGVVAEAAFLTLALLPAPSPSVTVLLAATAFAGYGFAALPRGGAAAADPRLVLGFAALFRLTLLFTPPMLSDDVNRYLWDGRVQAEAINPYRHPPASSQLDGIDDQLRAGINNPEIPTIYPPASQILFLTVAFVSPTVPMMKAALILFEFLGILILWRIVKRLNRSPAALLLYAWNPLAVIEVSGNGHNDPLGVCFLLLAVLLILQNRSGLSIAALGGSVGAKLGSAALLPFFFATGGRRGHVVRIASQLAIFCGVVGLLYLPYLSAGRSLWTGLRAYSDRWRGNDFGFSLILGLVERWDLTDALKRGLEAIWWGDGDSPILQFLYRHVHPVDQAKVAVGMILVVVLVTLLRRHDLDLPGRIFVFLGWALLLTPILHPWYVLWILPFAALYGSAGWILFSALVLLAYLPRVAGTEGITPLRLAEYLPLLVLLVIQYYRNWRSGDPV
jgi:hypothetical protein